MAKKDYTLRVGLNHNEKAIIVNTDTGEMKDVKHQPNNIPSNMEIWKPGLFKKSYTKSWQYLSNNLSAIEFKAAYSLALLAKANTNSLEPVGDETAYHELSVIMDVSKNVVDRVLKKLFYYGVFGKFEVIDPSKSYTKFWILNPYLSFDGQIIKSDIAQLFNGTRIALNFHDKDNIN